MNELKYLGLDTFFNNLRFMTSHSRSNPQVPHIHRDRFLSEVGGIIKLGATNRKAIMQMRGHSKSLS